MAKKTSPSRRDFILTTVKGSVGIAVGMNITSTFITSCTATKKNITNDSIFKTNFDQTPLPYPYNALEDIIDSKTMEIHYTKHAATYSKNVKEAVIAENIDTKKSLEEILAEISKYSLKMRNNGGGHYNHELFWQCMRQKRTANKPAGNLLSSIEKKFGSFENFKIVFSEAAKTLFGSGWAWLYMDAAAILKIGSTTNQDNPLMDICEIKGIPLLGLDVWEHAYYLKYQNKRADYIANWWDIVNWDFIQQRYEKIKG